MFVTLKTKIMFNKFLTGGVGILGVQGVDSIPTDGSASEIIKIAVQLIIGLFSLFSLLKKPKTVISNQNSNH